MKPVTSASVAVYPRVCGGTAPSIVFRCSCDGLSPRVRGNRCGYESEARRLRSIPACAGEPLEPKGLSNTREVYPRVCGGTAIPNLRTISPHGLSPRVRGNPFKLRLFNESDRSIPACAGEPSSMPSWASRMRVYPRVCGGTQRPIEDTQRRNGLSPRVRGNPIASSAAVVSPGSIPACAGEPQWAR